MFKKNTDLSTGILQSFVPDLVANVGFEGDLTCIAYDAVQSLMAAGTSMGSVIVLGEGGVQREFALKKKKAGPIKFVRFVKSVYLVAVDASNVVIVWGLDTGEEWAHHQSSQSINCIHTDPTMDWLFLGHHNGNTTAFDIDRGSITPFKIDNLERIVNPANRMGYVQSLALNPRDPGTILICYREVAVVWNIVRAEVVYDMVGEFPLHAATWHPSGSHIATSHHNGQITFWDSTKGAKVGSRLAFGPEGYQGPTDMAWCCREDPADTYIVLSSGTSVRIVDFGPTPTVSVTSYDSMGHFYQGGSFVDVKLPSHISGPPTVLSEYRRPHFGGNHNPSAAIFMTQSGQLVVISLPDGRVMYLGSVLPPALSWRAAQRTCMTFTGIPRHQWLGMMAASPKHYLHGGRSGLQKIRRQPLSAVTVAGFEDGCIKLFDATNADSKDVRVVSTSLPRGEVPIAISAAGEAGEMAAASSSGNVFLFTFKRNAHAGVGAHLEQLSTDGPPIEDIARFAPAELREGFVPLWLIRSPVKVTALRQSNVGFVAMGRDDGRIQVIDRRGPATIFDQPLQGKGEATFISFGIMVVGSEPYSSIVMSVGTSRGSVEVYRVLPRPQGGFYVEPCFSFSVGKDPILHVAHIDTGEGKSATAIPETMARLASGIRVQGAVLAVTIKDARMVGVTGAKPGQKLGTKSFDTPLLAAAYSYMRFGSSSTLVTVNSKGKTGMYALPGLSTISTFPAPRPVGNPRVGITEMGDVFLPIDQNINGGSIIRVWGANEQPVTDEVFMLRNKVPMRPTISTVSWVVGYPYSKPEDVDKKIGGSRRSKSRRGNQQLVETSAGESEDYARAGGVPKAPSSGGSGWFGSRHKHQVKKSPKLQKSWAQTLDEYYDAAEKRVNESLDDAVGQVKSSKGDASRSVMGGIVRGKLGF